MKLNLLAAGLCLSLCVSPMLTVAAGTGAANTANESAASAVTPVATTVSTAASDVDTPKRMTDAAARSLLKTLMEQAAIPIYSELDQQAATLAATSRNFCAKPTAAGLQQVRSDWAATLSVWQQSSALAFGPTVEDGIDFTVYFRPVKKAVIKGLLAAETTLDQPAVAKAGVGGQGLATLEYLLFDREQSDQQLIKMFSAVDNQHCAYLVAASGLLAENLHIITQSWNKDGDNYAEAVMTAGAGSAYFTAAYQPIELLVNRFYQAIQAIEIKKLGVPLGLRGSRSGKPRAYPHKLEAWRSGYSLANINSTLAGLQRVFVDGGIQVWLQDNGHAELATKLETQLKQLLATKWEATDLFNTLAAKPEAVKPFYEQVQVLAATVREELAPALGVQLGFNANDGD